MAKVPEKPVKKQRPPSRRPTARVKKPLAIKDDAKVPPKSAPKSAPKSPSEPSVEAVVSPEPKPGTMQDVEKSKGLAKIIYPVIVLAVVIGTIYATLPVWSPYLQAYLPASRDKAIIASRIGDVSERLNVLEKQNEEQKSADHIIKGMEEDRARLSQQLSTIIAKVNALDEELLTVKKMAAAITPPSVAADAKASLQQLSERFSKIEARGEELDTLLQRINKLEKTKVSSEEINLGNEHIANSITDISDRVYALEESGITSSYSTNAESQKVLALSQLREALRDNAAFVQKLQTLKSVIGDDPEILPMIAAIEPFAATGIATLKSLRERFGAMTLKVSSFSMAVEGDGWIGKTLNRLSSLVSVRRVDANTAAKGNVINDAVARADESMKNGDLTAAVTALNNLSGPPAEAANAWMKDARTRLLAERTMASLHVMIVSLLSSGKE